MTRLFRSKSCCVVSRAEFNPVPQSPCFHDEEEEEEEFDSDDDLGNPASTPFINPGSKTGRTDNQARHSQSCQSHNAILDILMSVLKKSLITCSVEREDVSSMDISWPTNVRHVSHVTFDKFNGFLGLPTELEPEVPRRVPSASAKVFGVSAKSMQCSYDDRGNSVPTILLMMQKQLYSDGGLKAEGIFRINAENSQEEFVRDQLNRGLVPHGIDVHCLSGLIKAWFRELPRGVLDSLTPEQVMHCNTEDDCTNLVKSLPPTEAALLDWAINLMADVVEHEQFNKMNARNIAMVFAPNMTQMADPLTSLIHAVQLMNLLKTLILKSLGERENATVPSCEESGKQTEDACAAKAWSKSKLLRTSTLGRIEWNAEAKLWGKEEKENEDKQFECVSRDSTPSRYQEDTSKYDKEHWLRLRKGVLKLCRHPVFQLSKPSNKKPANLGIVNTNTRGRGREAWFQ